MMFQSAFNFRSVVIGSMLMLSASIHAQDEVSVQFVSFPRVADTEPVELYVGEGKTIEVELPTNALSQVYKVPRLSQWMLGKSVVGEDGKPSFSKYGQAPVDSSAKQLVLVVRKGALSSDGFDLIPMATGGGGLNGGKYLFFNAAKVAIAGEVGDSKFALQPLKHLLMAPKPSEVKGERKYLFTTLYFRKGEEAKPFYTSTWRFSEKARSFVFFYHDPHTNQLRLHSIRDYLP